MKWFGNGIPSAIQKAKDNKSVFIVLISGTDEASRQMESFLHNNDVTSLCEENRCVAVRLEANSNESKFFSQIYPVVVIPSTFFIGDNGVPLEVIGECKTNEDFLKKVQNALELQRKSSQQEKKSPTQPEASTSSEKVEDGATGGASTSSKDANDVDAQTVEGAAASPGASSPPSGSTGSGDDQEVPEKKAKVDEDLDSKLERAQRLVEQKREDKARKEADDEKRKEMERRNVGRGVQELKQKQKEADLLEAARALKKEREEDRLARQRVKEQIARDRAERNKTEKDNAGAAAAEKTRQQNLLSQQAAQVDQARRSEFARIQFRLPDGSSITQQFSATDKFATVYEFITGQLGTAFSLSRSFPRKSFTTEDHNSTLQELELAPSAVILVLPGLRSTTGIRSSSSLSITNILFSPFLFIWNMIASLFGFSRQPPSQSTAQPPRSGATGGDRNTSSAYQRTSSSRQEGAIHRFHNAEDDESDEDRNTWNGNSTQQM